MADSYTWAYVKIKNQKLKIEVSVVKFKRADGEKISLNPTGEFDYIPEYLYTIVLQDGKEKKGIILRLGKSETDLDKPTTSRMVIPNLPKDVFDTSSDDGRRKLGQKTRAAKRKNAGEKVLNDSKRPKLVRKLLFSFFNKFFVRFFFTLY